MRRLSVTMALLTVGLGLGFRWLRVADADLGPKDLALYEDRPYGVDLPDWYGENHYFLLWSRGDGQGFVTLAADLLLEGPVHGFAAPSFRLSRVGYAWLGRVFALGRADLIPIGLFLVNVVALAAIGWISGTFATRGRRGAALLLAINPGVHIAVASDTAEAVGVALALGAVLVAQKGAAIGASALLGIVRPEVATVLPTSPRRPALVTVTAAVAALVLRMIGLLAFPDDRRLAGAALGQPLVGYLRAWPHQRLIPALGSALVLVAGVTAIYVGLRARRGWTRLGWVATGLLTLFLSADVLIKPDNYLRAAVGFPLLWLDRRVEPVSSVSS